MVNDNWDTDLVKCCLFFPPCCIPCISTAGFSTGIAALVFLNRCDFNSKKESNNYCNRKLFLSAFILLIILSVCAFQFTSCFLYKQSRKPDWKKNDNTNNNNNNNNNTNLNRTQQPQQRNSTPDMPPPVYNPATTNNERERLLHTSVL